MNLIRLVIILLSPKIIKDFNDIYDASSINDHETLDTIAKVYEKYDYISDPHTATGLNILMNKNEDETWVSLVCAHPAKFNDAVKKAIKKEIDIPKELSNLFDKEEKMTILANSTQEVKIISLKIFNMQKITELDNGLRIVTQNMPGLETVSMGIWNFVGGRDETKDINGVAHLLEHMAFKGTKTKSALQIAETIENVGGDINAYTSKEITAYYVKLLADDLPYGIDILTDILQNSTFAEEELNRERGVIIQEIGMYLDTPDDMIFDYWQEKAYPNQPMGRSILGKTDIIKNISREEVKNFMFNHYNPKKMIISAAGKINHNKFVDSIKKLCTNLPSGLKNSRIKADYMSGEYREDKKLEQIHLLLGFEGIDYNHDDFYSLLVYSSL